MTIEAQLDSAAALRDDLARAKAAHALLPEADAIKRRAVSLRGEAVLEANRSGLSFDVLAAELDVSKSLIQKVVREAKEAEAIAAGPERRHGEPPAPE